MVLGTIFAAGVHDFGSIVVSARNRGQNIGTLSGKVVSARELSGAPGLLFRRNSQTGCVEALPTDSSRWGGINTTLHSND